MINNLVGEALTVTGFDNSASLQVVAVGTAVNCNPVLQSSPTLTLARKPSGSSATMSSGSFTPDLPGLYQVTVTQLGLPTRTLNLVAIPSALTNLTVRPNGPAISTNAVFQMLVAHLNEWSAASFANSVENATTGPQYGFNSALLNANVTAANAAPINFAPFSST